MCVASYGVIPQAYSVAVGPAAATTVSPPLAVSAILVSGPRPGRSGTRGPRQESIGVRLSLLHRLAFAQARALRAAQPPARTRTPARAASPRSRAAPCTADR